jgi:hypothetical protein
MKIKLDEFRQKPATQIVSLGPRCATSYNLRRYFNFSSAFPFDWWISPEVGVADVLRNLDVEKIYDPDRIEITPAGQSVRHKDFGILLHHEFPRHSEIEGHTVKENFRDFIAGPKQRTQHLFAKLADLNREGERIAFVREQIASDEIEAALLERFDLAQWCLISIDKVTEESVHGWKCNPILWDALLEKLNISLDPTAHRPFKEGIAV